MSDHIHYNKPQMREAAIDAHESWCIWGRGTGKTEGPLARRFRTNTHTMRRACGGFVGATYQRILTNYLPKICASLARQGYYRDVHYFMGEKPPKKWIAKYNWKEPYVPPFRYDYFMSWYTGSGVHIISQDRPGTANGLDIAWLAGDEVKFLKKEKLEQELYPTLRGQETLFGHLPEYQGKTMVTDMPTGSTGRWILEMEKKMDGEAVKLIMALQLDLFEGRITKEVFKELHDDLRRDLVYVDYASTLDNIEVLGVNYMKEARRSLPKFIYETAILNMKPSYAEQGFYPYLDEEHHLYNSYNYSHLDKFGYDFAKIAENINCNQDEDMLQELPIEVTMDYGGSINCLIASQQIGNELRILKNFYLKHPSKPRDVVKEFCEYYRFKRDRSVRYAYDHTAVSSMHNFRDEVIDAFMEEGWQVEPIYVGQAPSHNEKFILISTVFKEEKPEYPVIRINRDNCRELIISLQQAALMQGYKGFEKDKRSEKKKDEEYPQEEATHFSDAFDTLIYSICSGLNYEMPAMAITIFKGN